ncbi:hypothetical protein EK21DRAFT_111357 [Setomelanomma holmii]|uniref:Uncharacterized protein n=1 Tax=Setomelanomma holmii TaxID=210430 RepID=A0A9P4HDL4_9PLEO|nr:hypothetical protein EK21DRAFT_111357 [Setomelanomma holmii]
MSTGDSSLVADTNYAPAFLGVTGVFTFFAIGFCGARIYTRIRPKVILRIDDYMVLVGTILCTANFFLSIGASAHGRGHHSAYGWLMTFQEFVCAPHAIFEYGGKFIHEDALFRVLMALYNSRGYLLHETDHLKLACAASKDSPKHRTLCRLHASWEDFLSHVIRALLVFLQKRNQESKGLPGLVDLIGHSRFRKASDKKDHVYAFLGVAKHNYGVVADYSEDTTPEDVFTDVATKVMSCDRNLDILYRNGAVNAGRTKGLPSWVADWTMGSKKGTVSALSFDLHEMDEIDWAGKTADVSFSDDGQVMEVSGILIDEIVLMHDAEPSDNAFGGSCCSSIGYVVSIFLHEVDHLVGDQLWLLYGGTEPFVLRPVGSSFELIASAKIEDELNGPGVWRELYEDLQQRTPVRVRLV